MTSHAEDGLGVFRWLPDSAPVQPIPGSSILDSWLRDKAAIEKNPAECLQYLLTQEEAISQRHVRGIFQLGKWKPMVVISDYGLLKELLTLPYPLSYISKSTEFCMTMHRWNSRVLSEGSQLPPCQFLNGIEHHVTKAELQTALKLNDDRHLQGTMQVVHKAIHDLLRQDLTGASLEDTIFQVVLTITQKLYGDVESSDKDANSNTSMTASMTAKICEKFSSNAVLTQKRYRRCPLSAEEARSVRQLVDSTELRSQVACALGDTRNADSTVQLSHALVVNMMQPLRHLLTNVTARWVNASEDQQRLVREEVCANLLQVEVQDTSLHTLHQLDAFVCEVLRLHPARELFFWRTQCDISLARSSAERYKIPKGREVVGNVFTAQRQHNVFAAEDLAANEFHPQRFILKKELKERLLWSHGTSASSAQLDNHQCPAKELVHITAKLFLAALCRCNMSLSATPTWTSWRPGCIPVEENITISVYSLAAADNDSATSANAMACAKSATVAMERAASEYRTNAGTLFRSLTNVTSAGRQLHDAVAKCNDDVSMSNTVQTCRSEGRDVIETTLDITQRLRGKLSEEEGAMMKMTIEDEAATTVSHLSAAAAGNDVTTKREIEDDNGKEAVMKAGDISATDVMTSSRDVIEETRGEEPLHEHVASIHSNDSSSN